VNKRLVMLCGFLFLLSIGSIFDTMHIIEMYGWNYNITTIINDGEMQTVEYDASNSLVFVAIIFINLLFALSLLIEVKRKAYISC